MKANIFPEHDCVPVVGRFKAVLDFLFEQKLEDKVMVDVGSSTGLLESKLKNKKLKKIIGIEPNREAISFAKKRLKGVSFFVSTADKLPLESSSIDVITMFDVIEHVPTNGERDALLEASRVLRKKGVFLLTTPNDNLFVNLLDPAWYIGHRHYQTEKLKKMIEEVGLEVKEMRVRGSIWASIYMLWFYINKWIFKNLLPRSHWLEKKDDFGYEKNKGIFTIFVRAEKI